MNKLLKTLLALILISSSKQVLSMDDDGKEFVYSRRSSDVSLPSDSRMIPVDSDVDEGGPDGLSAKDKEYLASFDELPLRAIEGSSAMKMYALRAILADKSRGDDSSDSGSSTGSKDFPGDHDTLEAEMLANPVICWTGYDDKPGTRKRHSSGWSGIINLSDWNKK